MSALLRHRGRAYFADEALAEVPVRIGDVKVAAGESLLYCIGLGSCVAVALYDAYARTGGIAHAVLPMPERARGDSPHGRFVSAAVPELIGLLQDAGAGADRLRARLAGGAAMFPDLLGRQGLQLGRRNVETAREALAAAGIPVDGEDVLGTHGRSVFLRTTDGKLLVTSVVYDAITL